MSVFSTNQVRHFYTANGYSASISPASPIGTAQLKSVGEDMCLQYMGVDGLMRSDLVKKSTVFNISAKAASAMVTYLRKDNITIDAGFLSAGNIDTTKIPVGTEVLLRTTFFQWGSLSQEDQYMKYGSVTVEDSMSASALYTKLASNLKLNYSREQIPLFNIFTEGAIGGITMQSNPDYKFIITAAAGSASASKVGNIVTITPKTAGTVSDINTALTNAGIIDVIVSAIGTLAAVATATALVATKIVLSEIEQPWVLGRKENMPLQYKLGFTTSDIYTTANGIARMSNIVWCTSDTKESDTNKLNTIKNGKIMADMEYFMLGERGDVYRNVGFPNTIPTTYLIDPTKEYDIIEFDYKYIGSGVDVQESVKHLEIVCEATSHTIANALIGQLNTILSTSVATL